LSGVLKLPVLLIAVTISALCLPAMAAEEFRITPDVVYGHKAGMALTYDVIQNQDDPNGAAVMFMMSGGWFSGWIDPERFTSNVAPSGFGHFRQLLDAGYTLVIVRHGSAPYFKVPDAVADVRRAVRHFKHDAKKWQVDPKRIGVTGASAGGHLSLMLGTAAEEGKPSARNEVDRMSTRVAAVVAYYPPVDLRESVGPSRSFPALDFSKSKAPDVSPLLFVTSDDAPTLLVHGDKDRLVPLDNSERIQAALDKASVANKMIVIEGARHGFGGKDGLRASKALVEWFDLHLRGVQPADAPEAAAAPAAPADQPATQPAGESAES